LAKGSRVAEAPEPALEGPLSAVNAAAVSFVCSLLDDDVDLQAISACSINTPTPYFRKRMGRMFR
jgi:hypothetical protein